MARGGEDEERGHHLAPDISHRGCSILTDSDYSSIEEAPAEDCSYCSRTVSDFRRCRLRRGCCTLAKDRFKSLEKRGLLVPSTKNREITPSVPISASTWFLITTTSTFCSRPVGGACHFTNVRPPAASTKERQSLQNHRTELVDDDQHRMHQCVEDLGADKVATGMGAHKVATGMGADEVSQYNVKIKVQQIGCNRGWLLMWG
ncbi:hypothetical protein AKJ16_DCAP25353 [Drosera capensis]